MANSPQSELDSHDGLPVSEVGKWAERKHEIISHYIKISSTTRAKFPDTVFVDLYCGPGRARIKDSSTLIDGSAVVAWKASNEPGFASAPFRRVLIADKNQAYVDACESRLHGAPVTSFSGEAGECAEKMLSTMNQSTFALVLIDPFNLEGLSYDLIERFSTLKYVDFIVHFSTMEVQRNIDRYFDSADSPLDKVAPGWRGAISSTMTSEDKLRAVFNHWNRVICDTGFSATSDPQAIINSKNRWIYWLAFASRHPLAANFWSKIKNIGPQGELF